MAYNVQAKRRCGPPPTTDSIPVAGRNGASTLYLANHSFSLAYAVSERRFAVCYTPRLLGPNPLSQDFPEGFSLPDAYGDTCPDCKRDTLGTVTGVSIVKAKWDLDSIRKLKIPC